MVEPGHDRDGDWKLAWCGLRCVMIDRRTEPLRFPTSESVHARTMEHFRRWGIADAVRYAGFPPDPPRNVSFVTRLTGFDLGRIDEAAAAQSVAFDPIEETGSFLGRKHPARQPRGRSPKS